MCMVCVMTAGVEICNHITEIFSEPQIPELKIVEKALKEKFGKWSFELNREQAKQLYFKHAILRRAQEIVDSSSGDVDLNAIKDALINEFGQTTWEANRKQVLVAKFFTLETVSYALIHIVGHYRIYKILS